MIPRGEGRFTQPHDPTTEHPMDSARRNGAVCIPGGIVGEICEAANDGRPTGWATFEDRDGDLWDLTDETYDGDAVMMPYAGDMEPMLRRDVEHEFGPLQGLAEGER